MHPPAHLPADAQDLLQQTDTHPGPCPFMGHQIDSPGNLWRRRHVSQPNTRRRFKTGLP
jgi:hypothetical protein